METTLTPAHTILSTEKLPLQPVLPADCCPAGALWRVWLARGELLFCGHHARQYGFAGDDSHSAYASVEANRQKGSDHA